MPTREDVDLARAAIDRGFLTIKESIKCLEIQREYENSGRQVPLEHIFIEADFLTDRQLATLKESLAKSAALRHVGPYEILSRLGAGGMGTVYKAKDTKADRAVALKVLSPAHAGNREYIQRFLREAHASGRLSHPNVVQGYDAGEANGQYYFAMEFIDGITVGDMLKEGRAIPEQQALDIAIQVAKALEHAESHSLVHRDIKPDNIMITKEGAAKLADLGLARLTTGESPAEQRSLGTAYYASPEQCQGSEDLDSKSDMYSFGATLFHMLAGRVPFNDDSPEGIMTMHVEEKRPYLKDQNVQLSHGISKIVRKLMAKDKRERYENFSEVLKDLTLVRMGRSPRLGEHTAYDTTNYRYRSPTGSWRTKPPKDRRKAILAITGAAVLVIGLVVGAFVYQNWNRKLPKEPEAPPNDAPANPRPEDQSFLEDNVLAERAKLPPHMFYERLQLVARKYPNTNSAKRALQIATDVLKEVEKEIEPEFNQFRDTALKLRDGQQYKAAIDKIAEFPVANYGYTSFPRKAASLQKEILADAEASLKTIKARADDLVKEKKFDEASALYQPVIEKFGLPALATQADAERTKINEIKEAERKRQEDEEQKQAAERERQEAIKQERLATRAAVTEARGLAVQGKFADAAQVMTAAAAKATIETVKASLTRAANDLDHLRQLVNALKADEKSFKGKPIAILRRDGTSLEGTAFSFSDNHISVLVTVDGARAMRSVPWEEIAPASLKNLIQSSRGVLGVQDHYALFALFSLTGQPDKAKAELDPYAADPLEKDAVRLRKADLDFFNEQDAGDRPDSEPKKSAEPAG